MVSLDTFKKIMLALPGISEQPHFEKSSFRVNKKILATLDVVKKQASIKLSLHEQGVFCSFDKTIIYPVQNKWGLQGWTIIDLQKSSKDMCIDLIEVAYRSMTGS